MKFNTRVFEEYSPYIKILTIYLALMVAVYAFLLAPKIKARRGLQENLARLEADIKRNREMLGPLRLPDAEEKRNWAKVRSKLERTAAENDIPPMMQQLTQMALRNHIADATFSVARGAAPPGASAGSVKWSGFTIRMSFHCQYRDLGLFLKDLDGLPQQMTIESLEVKKAVPLIAADMQVRPFSVNVKK